MLVPSWRTRPAPSQPRQLLLHRPRLSDLVAGRWHRRLTAVVAGAGFGKSGLVVEALAANRREPMGHDAWVGCQAEDARLDRLFEAIFIAVRGEGPRQTPHDLDDAVQRIANAVWSHAPEPVSIVLDDVHVLVMGSSGAELLEALVRRLPANTNFVLTSRTTLPVSSARLLSAGEAIVLTESDLAMTAGELRTFAEQRGRPELDLTTTGGWPALAELAVHTGVARSPELADYLTDELLQDLPKSQVQALALLSVVGPLDVDQLVSIVGDHDLDHSALAGLPMVDTASGVVEAHALWDVATRFIDPGWLRDATRGAAEALWSAGSTERAFRLAVDARDDALALEILGDLCGESIHMATDVDLGSCVAALSVDRRHEPAALLAAALVPDPGGWVASRDHLIAASLALEEGGATSLELVALTRLGISGWQAGDLSVADHLLPRIEMLAGSGDPSAVAVVALGTAVMAEIGADHDTMWTSLAAFEALDVPEPLRTIGGRFRASMDLQYGAPADALRRVVDLEATADTWFRSELRVLAMWACWLDGDDRSARHWADQLRSRDADRGQEMVAHANVALLDAWSPMTIGTGPEHGRTHVPQLLADAVAARSAGLLVPSLVLSMAASTTLVDAGEEAEAQMVLAEAFADPETELPRARSAIIRGLALVWVLLPERREELAKLELGRGPAAAMEAARALCDAREVPTIDRSWCGRAEAVLADPGVATRLPAMWLAELAARVAGPKPTDAHIALARDAVDQLGPAAAHALRRLAASSSDRAVVAGATAILSRRTPVSEGRFVMRLLGPMVLERDGEVIERPDWRRDRVRALFALIATHGTITRRDAADALWPDLGAEAQANNLRVTLSYLQKVLEPERTRHELAYHVRGDGASLRFAGRSSWTIDVQELEVLLDAAERDDQRGASAAALDGYLSAIDWYRGPLLADVVIDASDEIERDRLRSRYVRALLRAGSLLLAAGRSEQAQRLAVAAQVADPWSDQAVCLQTECLLALGDRSAARRSHQRAVDLTIELDLPPSPALRRLGRTLAT